MKKVCLVLLAALCLTACNETTKLPPSHYDQLGEPALHRELSVEGGHQRAQTRASL